MLTTLTVLAAANIMKAFCHSFVLLYHLISLSLPDVGAHAGRVHREDYRAVAVYAGARGRPRAGLYGAGGLDGVLDLHCAA